MTDVALKDYLENMIHSLRREVVSWRESDKAALRVAEIDIARRLEVHNEWRNQLEKERENFANKSDITAVEVKVETTRQSSRVYTDSEISRLNIPAIVAQIEGSKSYTDSEIQRLKASLWGLIALSFTVGGALGAAIIRVVFS
jgi:hypothetical protein